MKIKLVSNFSKRLLDAKYTNVCQKKSQNGANEAVIISQIVGYKIMFLFTMKPTGQ